MEDRGSLEVQARSCLIYAFSASAKDLRPALIAGLIRGVSGLGLFMRQLRRRDKSIAANGKAVSLSRAILS